MRAQRASLTSLGLVLIAGCGGGGGGGGSTSTPTPLPGPPIQQSAGGIWAMPGGPDTAVTMFIAENGRLMVFDALALGTGAVLVTNTNEVAGSYERLAFGVVPASSLPPNETCEFTGTVVARTSLRIEVRCEDSAGTQTSERTLALLYSMSYEGGSSLDMIAGNYESSIPVVTPVVVSTLSVSNNGQMFGSFRNGGIDCTVNGLVEIIDATYALYAADLTLSSCQGILNVEGEAFTGFIIPGLQPTSTGAFLLYISGHVQGNLMLYSMLFEPV